MFLYISLTLNIFCYCTDVFPAQGIHTYWSLWNSFCLANTWTLCVTWLTPRLDEIHILFILIIPCIKKGSTFMRLVLKYYNFANYLFCLLSVLTSQRQNLWGFFFVCFRSLLYYLFLIPSLVLNWYIQDEWIHACKMWKGKLKQEGRSLNNV